MIGDFTPWGTGRKNSPGWIEDGRGCHIWIGARTIGGYALVGGCAESRLVHRVRYEREIGPIPEGYQLDHFVCDNGAGGCCNPHHCRPVTHRENVLRSRAPVAFQRAQTHCKRGHPLTPDNLLPSAERSGKRQCQLCAIEWRRARYEEQLARSGRTRTFRTSDTHCREGHPLTPDNLVPARLKFGKRTCRICFAAYQRAYYLAKKQRQSA